MKKFFLMAIAALMMSGVAMAQTTDPVKDYKQVIKERKAINKLTQKQIDSKRSKESKKQAKDMAKKGWMAAPGTQSLEKQLNDLFLYQNTMVGELPKYIVGNANAIGGNYAAAKKQAIELARIQIAEQIEAEIAEITETNVGNKQLDGGEAESITSTMSSAKSLVKQKLGRTTVVFESYRDLPGNKKEVQINIVYDGKAAMSDVIKQFESQSKELQDKLSEMLGLK